MFCCGRFDGYSGSLPGCLGLFLCFECCNLRGRGCYVIDQAEFRVSDAVKEACAVEVFKFNVILNDIFYV